MTENPDLRSVRVEVEADSSGSVDVPAILAREGASKLAIIAGMAGLGLAGVLMILALRPNDARSADAETAVPTTVAGVNDDESGDAQVTNAAESERPSTLFEETVGAEELQSIVRAPFGFLGLTGKESLQIPPNIVRSANGVDWVDVDVSFDDTVALGGSDVAVRSYQQLIRTESGYALLMTTRLFHSMGDRSPFTSRIDRLTSPNGAIWSIDPTFAPIDVSGGPGRFTRVNAHRVDSFVVLTSPLSPVNKTLRDLLEANVDDNSSFEEACSVELMGEGQLFVLPCLGEGLPIDAADTIDPDRFDDLTACAVFLSQGWMGGVSFWVVNRGQRAAELVGTNSLLIPPTVTDDGRAVAIEFSGTPRLDAAACEGPGVDNVPSPAVVVWDPEAAKAPIRLPIPDDVELVDLMSVRTDPAVIGRDLLVLLDSGVRLIDIESGEWVELLTFPSRLNDETSMRLSRDGTELIQLSSSRVTVTDLRTGEKRAREDVGGGNRPGFPAIMYADDEVVFAQGGNAVFKVELPDT